MSLLARIGRALQSPRHVAVDGAKAYGAAGETMARHVLDGTDYYACYNPIVPHPEKAGKFLETDAIVYGEGSLFCVEAKRYRGALEWSYRSDGSRRLLKYKAGNYGEGVFERSFPDPLAKTKFYISILKRYLARVDDRFGRLYFHPVVAFVGEKGEISGVRCFDEGYIGLEELAGFIQSRRNDRFAARRSRWIVEGLENLPGWDVVTCSDGERHYGTLAGEGIALDEPSGGKRTMRYSEMQSLDVSPGGRLSAADDVEVLTGDGRAVELRSSFAGVRLDAFETMQSHRLRDVSRIEVGTHRYREHVDGPLVR